MPHDSHKMPVLLVWDGVNSMRFAKCCCVISVKAIISPEWERSVPCRFQALLHYGDVKGTATCWTQIRLKNEYPLQLQPDSSECQMILLWEPVKPPSQNTAVSKSPHLIWLIWETLEYVIRHWKHNCSVIVCSITEHGNSFKSWWFFLVLGCLKVGGGNLIDLSEIVSCVK